MTNSRMTLVVGALAIAAAFGIGVTAQGTGQQTQGRGGAAGGQTQAPVRDTQAQTQKPSTGLVSGVVTVEGAGTPVRRARVSLSGPELRGARTTITNDQGQFNFAALPAGRFTVTASKAGYLDIPFGAKKAGRPGTPIQLADGQKMERANISLPKGGVITGVVVDDNGEPTPRTQVRAMRYVIRTGEKALQQAGTDQTDDRGMYRIYGLQPGDYLVSAIPQNYNIGDLRQTITAEIESLIQQVQNGPLGAALGAALGGQGGAGGGAVGGRGGGGRGGGAGVAGIDINQILGGGGRGGGNPAAMDRLQQLQDQLSQQEGQQTTTYAPVYYPGTATPSTASNVTLAVAEERNGVDFRLMLVPTAKIDGTVSSPDGVLPQGTQLTLMPLDQGNMPAVPGVSTNTTRVNQDGTFNFRDVPPGQYRVMARGAVRQQDPTAAAGQNQGFAGGRGQGGMGQGGRGMGPGQISQVLWGSADVNVNGEDVKGVTISLQEGMTVTGRIAFDTSSALPPSDLSSVRLNLSARGTQQGMDMGGVPPATVDATGRFTIKGVLPGKYSISAAVPGGGAGGRGGAATGAAGAAGGRGGAAGATTGTTTQWVLKSAIAGNKDALDFGLVIEPNQDVSATIMFGEKTQEVSGTIQDTMGNPTADYTIILFAADKNYWVPQARRIQAVRPGTDGKFTFRNLPVGDYRLTAVTDVEPGEWFDPNFLEQLGGGSIVITLRDGEKKTQDIKVAGGGH